MNIVMNLSPKEVEEILREHLSVKFGSVGEIKMRVGTELRGLYTNEHYESVFKGVSFEAEI